MESDTAAATPATADASRQGRGRSVAMWTTLVVAGLLLLLSSFAVWVNRVALNTKVFTDTSSELLADNTIRSAVATRAVDELFSSVDVQAEVQKQLPKDFKSLAGPATAGLRQASYQIVDRALEQPRLQSLFAQMLEETHRTLVQVLEGGGSRVSTQGGDVTLNLNTIITEAADRIGIGKQVADKIPADAGQIVVLRSDQLKTAQNGFQLLKTLAWFLPVLTLLAFAGAVLLARERRRAVRGVGAVLVAVGALGLLAANLTRNYLVNALVADRENRPAANDAWNILTDLMRSTFRWMILIGILFLIAAWLAGPGRRALASRRVLAPALRNRVWAYLVLALAGVLLLLNSSVVDFTRFLVLVVLLALGATWIELTRGQTLREFPDAGTELFGDARTRISGWWEERRTSSATAAAPSAPATSGDVTARLASLADLHSKGELTDEEYAAAKAQVLGSS
jgi:hypothetical protein